MSRSLFAGAVVAWLVGLAWCDAPKQPPAPQPSPSASATPSPAATPAPVPTPPPTPEPDACPVVDPALVRVACRRFSDWTDGPSGAVGEQWDCSPKFGPGEILPEEHPLRARCDLEAVGGRRPAYALADVTGDLRIGPRTNPFRFALYGHGSARLVCIVGDGHDACMGRTVSR